MSTFKTILLFVKPTGTAKDAANALKHLLKKYNLNIEIYKENKTKFKEKTLAFVIGGDGTYLGAAKALYGYPIPIVGINLGHLGFLTELDTEEVHTYLTNILNNKGEREQRPYFELTIMRNNKIALEAAPFVNDAVILRHPEGKMAQISAYVKNRLMIKHARSDGLIIATPTGSTAYNPSIGGPILHPETNALTISPICPHTLSFRPVVIPPFDVRIELEGQDKMLLSLDGRTNINLQPKDNLIIKRSSYNFTMLHIKERNFFQTLRSKMSWISCKNESI